MVNTPPSTRPTKRKTKQAKEEFRGKYNTKSIRIREQLMEKKNPQEKK